MNDSLIDIIFSPINMALSLLLILLFLYWIATMLFGVDFDLDFDVDIDVDVDMDVETGVGVEAEHISADDLANAEIKKENIRKKPTQDLKWWQVILVYFHFVELPFMFTFTVWILMWWALTMTFTFVTGSYDNAFGFVVFLTAVLPALFLTRWFTTPFKRFFKNFDKNGVESLEIAGRPGVAESNISGDRIGAVKLVIDSSPLVVYGKSIDGLPIKSGEQVLLIRESVDKKYFYIQSYQSNQ